MFFQPFGHDRYARVLHFVDIGTEHGVALAFGPFESDAIGTFFGDHAGYRAAIVGDNYVVEILRLGGQLFKRLDGLGVLALLQKPRGRATVPTIGMGQKGDQLGGRFFAQGIGLGTLEARGFDAIDTPAGIAGTQVDVFFYRGRNGAG